MLIIRLKLNPENYGDGKCWSRDRLLGEGGFGKVYLATTSSSKPKLNYIAVKSAIASASDSLKFEKEVLDKLRGCPEIIQCLGDEYTTSNRGNQVYNLLLEFASGGTLLDEINKHDDALPESVVQTYTRSIVRALRHMHGLGYVHCDLKPENILLVANQDSKFTAKIADLGLAMKLEGSNKKGEPQQPCTWKGTVPYWPPESMFVEGVQEASSDIWALGCIVLEMLTGKPAWGENLSDEKIADKMVMGKLPEIPRQLSPKAKAFLKLCLARNPSDRCQAQSLLYHPFLTPPDSKKRQRDNVSTVMLSKKLRLIAT